MSNAEYQERANRARPNWERASRAERRLTALEGMCRLQAMYVRRMDTFCYACYWEGVLKPLLYPLVGAGRGYAPSQAEDPSSDPWASCEPVSLSDLDDLPEPVPAESDAEAWLRTSEAWDAVSDYLLAIVYVADPDNGHGFARATRQRATAS